MLSPVDRAAVDAEFEPRRTGKKRDLVGSELELLTVPVVLIQAQRNSMKGLRSLPSHRPCLLFGLCLVGVAVVLLVAEEGLRSRPGS